MSDAPATVPQLHQDQILPADVNRSATTAQTADTAAQAQAEHQAQRDAAANAAAQAQREAGERATAQAAADAEAARKAQAQQKSAPTSAAAAAAAPVRSAPTLRIGMLALFGPAYDEALSLCRTQAQGSVAKHVARLEGTSLLSLQREFSRVCTISSLEAHGIVLYRIQSSYAGNRMTIIVSEQQL